MADSTTYSIYSDSLPLTTHKASTTVIGHTSTSSPYTHVIYVDPDENSYNPSTTISTSSFSVKSTIRYSTSTGISGNYGQGIPSSNYAGDIISSSSSSNPSINSIINNNSSVESNGNSTNINNEGQGENQGQGHLSLPAIIAISIITTLLFVGICFSCFIYKRRRNRINKLPGDYNSNSSSNKISNNQNYQENKFNEIDIQALPSTISPSIDNLRQPRFSQRDLNNILINQNNDNNNNNNSPFEDPLFISRRRNNLIRQQSLVDRSNEINSLYTDNSEFDMLAQDGSSYARTLSTYSEGINSEYSERDLGSYLPQNQSSTIRRPQLEIDTKSSSSSSNVGFSNNLHSISTSTFSNYNRLISPPSTLISNQMNNNISPFSDPSSSSSSSDNSNYIAQPLISPISSSTTNRSWRTEDELLFTNQSSHLLDRNSSRQIGTNLQRGLTIVRHIDGGAITPRSTNNENMNEEENNEVHLPPTYRELYPQNR